MVISVCDEPGCERTDINGRGLCGKHYQHHRLNGTLPDTPPDRICEQCGVLFSGRKWNARFCSRKCAQRHKGQKRLKGPRAVVCGYCGGSMDGKRNHAKYCSTECEQNSHKDALKAARLANKGPCLYCGQTLPLQRSRYCSDQCKSLARRATIYGLTQDELRALLAQHDVCAICGTDDWGPKGPQVDHDHLTGVVRGILCMRCNTMIGHADDDITRLEAAIAYLKG